MSCYRDQCDPEGTPRRLLSGFDSQIPFRADQATGRLIDRESATASTQPHGKVPHFMMRAHCVTQTYAQAVETVGLAILDAVRTLY